MASEWALNSLNLASFSNEPTIVRVPYGTPADEVSPRERPPEAQFTVLFAGEVGLRKGVPHLIEAWQKLGLKDARLLLAGSMDLSRDYLNQHAGSFEYIGPKLMPHAVGDPLDVVAYAVGALVAGLCWHWRHLMSRLVTA